MPSVRVLQAIAEALDLSAETLLEQAGLVRDQVGPHAGPRSRGCADDDRTVERAVRADRRLSHAQKEALIAVYRSYVGSDDGGDR